MGILPCVKYLGDEKSQDELTDFYKFCERSYGPRGHLKMIVSLADTMMVTSSSERIFNFLRIDNPFVETIIATSKNLSDFKLYFCMLTVELLRLKAKFGKDKISLSFLGDLMQDLAFPLDVGDIETLMNISRSVLRSKCGTGLLPTELKSLSRTVVESWLLSIRPDGSLGEVTVMVKGGAAEYAPPRGEEGEEDRTGRTRMVEGRPGRILEGVLYKLLPEDRSLKQLVGNSHIKVALFDAMLDKASSGEGWKDAKLYYTKRLSGVYPAYSRLAAHLNQAGVQLLACRKVIGENLRSQLESHGIKVIHRLGTSNFHRMVRMSGGNTMTSVHSRIERSDLGTISSCDLVEMDSAEYINFNSPGSGQVNLILESLTEENGEELRIQVDKCLTTLNNLVLKDGQLGLPGGGCTESALSIHVLANTKMDSRARKGLSKLLIKTATSVLKLNTTEAYIDSKHGHLWRDGELERCCCGLVNHDAIDQSTVKYNCSELLFTDVSVEKPKKISYSKQRNVVIDAAALKTAAFYTAEELAGNLDRVGMLISC